MDTALTPFLERKVAQGCILLSLVQASRSVLDHGLRFPICLRGSEVAHRPVNPVLGRTGAVRIG